MRWRWFYENPGRTPLTRQQKVPRSKVEHVWPFLRTREIWTCFWIRNLYLLVSLMAKIQEKYQEKTPLALVVKLILKNGTCNYKQYKCPENTVKLMANIPVSNYVSLFAKLLEHWLCSTGYSECLNVQIHLWSKYCYYLNLELKNWNMVFNMPKIMKL